jgi:hypothetical protein
VPFMRIYLKTALIIYLARFNEFWPLFVGVSVSRSIRIETRGSCRHCQRSQACASSSTWPTSLITMVVQTQACRLPSAAFPTKRVQIGCRIVDHLQLSKQPSSRNSPAAANLVSVTWRQGGRK